MAGQLVDITCRKCGAKRRITLPAKPGRYSVPCPNEECREPMIFVVQPKEIKMGQGTPSGTPAADSARNDGSKVATMMVKPGKRCGEIVHHELVIRNLMRRNRHFRLHEGSNTVGRADADKPSDISIDTDRTMSRRSVDILMDVTPEGAVFKLKVLGATNPVLHNGQPLSVGDEIYLTSGDTVKLGSTVFHFLPVKE